MKALRQLGFLKLSLRADGIPEEDHRVLALFRLSFAEAGLVADTLAREPVYLILAMTPDQGVRMKPQNLLTGLPVKHQEAAS